MKRTAKRKKARAAAQILTLRINSDGRVEIGNLTELEIKIGEEAVFARVRSRNNLAVLRGRG